MGLPIDESHNLRLGEDKREGVARFRDSADVVFIQRVGGLERHVNRPPRALPAGGGYQVRGQDSAALSIALRNSGDIPAGNAAQTTF